MLSSIMRFFRSQYIHISEYFGPEEFSNDDLKALAASVYHVEKYTNDGKTEEITQYINKLLEEIKENKEKFESSSPEMDPSTEKDYKLLIELDIRLIKIQKIVEKDLGSEK